MNVHQILVRKLGRVDYQKTVEEMQEFTRCRHSEVRDELWLLEHHPVYTQGYTCNQLPFGTSNIPIVSTDRGGQITYHGPGQLVIYLLLDIKRRNQGVRNLINSIEAGIIATLQHYRIEGQVRPKAPGVYVKERKVASLGIRVSRGCTYHGLSLNVDMDTSPFESIDVCGYKDLEVTTMHETGANCDLNEIATRCAEELAHELGYLQITYVSGVNSVKE